MDDIFWLGYPGLFISSFLAATILPFSSEAVLSVLLINGYDPVICLSLATAGNWLGGLTNYLIGYNLKWEWLEKYFRVKEQTILKQKRLIDRWKSFLAFFTWIPLIGDVFSIALGVYRSPFIPVALFMLLGKGLRYVVWGLLTIFGKNALVAFSDLYSTFLSYLV